MNKLLYVFIMIVMLLSCSEDNENIFDVSMTDLKVVFKPFPGGATMKYELPDNHDVFSIKASYKDHKGINRVVEGTYGVDSLDIVGFIEKTEYIPVNISLVDSKGNSSKPIIEHFSTEKCAASAFFDNLNVSTYWRGFKVEYTSPEMSNGLFHIGFLGVDAMTKKKDTILLMTKPISKGTNKIKFSNVYDVETNATTVVIWTEDFRGNIVNKQTFENVPASMDELLNGKDFIWHGTSQEDDHIGFSSKYLFDGDIRGTTKVEKKDGKYYAYVSGRNGVGQSCIIDLNVEKELSRIILYEPLRTKIGMPWDYVYRYPEYAMPNHVKVYGGNDMNAPMEEWDELGEFYQPLGTARRARWITRYTDADVRHETVESMNAEDPIFVQINFDMTEKTYRYLKIEFVEVFNMWMMDHYENRDHRVFLQELEVYSKK